MKNILVFFLCTVFVISCKRPTFKTKLEGKQMPDFKILAMDSNTLFSPGDLVLNSPSLLIYFSPYCPYCRAQVSELIKNENAFSHVQICLISNFPPSEIKKFAAEYKLEKYSNVKLGFDNEYLYAKYFMSPGVPFNAIYGRDKKLKGAYVGLSKSSDILALTNE